jgi:hypothetical protein
VDLRAFGINRRLAVAAGEATEPHVRRRRSRTSMAADAKIAACPDGGPPSGDAASMTGHSSILSTMRGQVPVTSKAARSGRYKSTAGAPPRAIRVTGCPSP